MNEQRKASSKVEQLEDEKRSLRADMQEQRESLLTVLRNFPEILYVTDPHSYEVIWVNKVFADLLGEDPTGKKCYAAFQGFTEPCDFCTNEIILKTRKPHVWEYRNPKLEVDFLITDQIIRWPDGRDVRFEHAVDITRRKRNEAELERHRSALEEVVAERTAELERAREGLARQAAEMLGLSTPILKIWDGVVVAPLVGTLDSERAERFVERLLESVVETRSEIAIVDITGVPTIDTQTAQYLIEATSAVRLLGARVMITGVRPAIAQTLVQLGIDLSGMTTKASLSAGLATALSELRLGVEAIEGGGRP